MAGPSRFSPVAEMSSSFYESPLSPQSSILTDGSIRDLTEELEEVDANPFACGGYSFVYQYRARNSSSCLSESGSTLFAVKAIRWVGRGIERKLDREIRNWASLNHPNVLKLHGIVKRKDAPFPSLVSDFMTRGTAVEYLNNERRGNIIQLIREITSGLSYLRGLNVVHGDIKGDNVLITHSGRACIGDFGLSRALRLDGTFSTTTTDGNRACRWTAPEYLDFNNNALAPSKEGDVWSLGCTMLQLISGQLPYYDIPNIGMLADGKVLLKIKCGDLPGFPPKFRREDFEKHRCGISAFCQLCWTKDRVHRPAIDILKSIICSYCADTEAHCSDTGNPKNPDMLRRSVDIRIKEEPEILSQVDDNGSELSSGSRRRSSSQSINVPNLSQNQSRDILEPLASEPRAEANLGISTEGLTLQNRTIPADLILSTTRPFFNMPPPPSPPTIETLLQSSLNKSAQMVLSELCQIQPSLNLIYESGETNGFEHAPTHLVICKINDYEYGRGMEGRKKQAKEIAARATLERLYLENPDYFPTLRYLPTLTSHLSNNNLDARVTWTTQSKASADSPEIWVYRRTFIFDGSPVVEGLGPTSAIAEERAARNVALAWHNAAANT